MKTSDPPVRIDAQAQAETWAAPERDRFKEVVRAIAENPAAHA